MALNMNNTAATDYSSLAAHSIEFMRTDSVQDQQETTYTNARWAQDWAYFNTVAKLRSAILMSAMWTVGGGYECDDRTKIILDNIQGNGKQTFLDILFNMDVCAKVGRDSYAEIVWNEDKTIPINLKILDPSTITKVFNRNGMIKEYRQAVPAPSKGIINKIKNIFRKDGYITFQPEDIFTLTNDCYAGEMHGRSIPESMEEIILADDENFKIMKKLTRFQAVPFIIFKVKSDNLTTINTFKANIKEARDNNEDLIIPDDENLLSWETVSVSPSAILMEWRSSLNQQFFQACGLPLVLFGSSGATESGGKIEYTAHEVVWRYKILKMEEQIKKQLGLEIKINHPASLMGALQADEVKDQQNALNYQPNDVKAGVGE
jgi:hypothetical protein